MLPNSITARALEFMKNGETPVNAVKLAFDQEQAMLVSLLGGSGNLSKLGEAVATEMSRKAYIRINNSVSPQK